MTDKIEEIRAALEGATQKRWRVDHDTEEGQPAMTTGRWRGSW